MDRRLFLGAAGGGAALAAPAIAQTQSPEIRWRMPSSFPRNLDVLFGSCEQLGRRVAQLTENRFRITPFPAGEIVPALQVLDAVSAGTVECGHSPSLFYVGKEAALAFFTCVPFGLTSRQMSAWLRNGDGMALAQEVFRPFNCAFLGFGDTGTQMGGWFRREIRSMQDLQGLKFRVAGFAGNVFERMGVVPTQIAPGDIYPSLERGVIDAAEFIGPYDDEKLGLNRIAKFYYAPGFWEPSSRGGFIVNLRAWEALPAHYRAAVEVALAEIDTTQSARYDALNPPALRRLVAGGAQLRSWPREVLQSAWKEANGLYEETARATRSSARCGTATDPGGASNSSGSASRRTPTTTSLSRRRHRSGLSGGGGGFRRGESSIAAPRRVVAIFPLLGSSQGRGKGGRPCRPT